MGQRRVCRRAPGRTHAVRILTLDGFQHRGQPIVLTEFDGIAFDKESDAAHTWGYSRARTEEDFFNLYRSLMEVVSTTFMFSGFCYTQFADTFQETNGLLRADRTPKIPIEQISGATRNVPIDR